MRIDEASRISGVSKDMIRHYEKLGLIRPARLANGYRDYTEGDTILLTMIKYLSNLGLPLKLVRDTLQTGRMDDIIQGMRQEEARLRLLKSQIDAHITAVSDSIDRFEQLASGTEMKLIVTHPFYLLSFGLDPAESDALRLKTAGSDRVFHYYIRMRFSLAGEAPQPGAVDRGLVYYSPVPDAQYYPPQRCLRVLIDLPSDQPLDERALAPYLPQARRLARQSERCVLAHRMFLCNSGGERRKIISAAFLLGPAEDIQAPQAELPCHEP